jgi:hypothetical protein
MMTEHTKVYTVNNMLETHNKIAELERQGYVQEKIFVLTHDKKRTELITKHTDGNEIGLAEEGILNATVNLFRTTGDELRAKLRAMGVSKEHAEQLESEMDSGKIVILVWSGTTYDNDNYDRNIGYYGYVPII